MSGLPSSGYQNTGAMGAPNLMGQTTQAPAMSTALPMNPAFLQALQGAQGQPMGGNGFPSPVPAQNPPTGGIAGNPGYSVAHPAQLNGNYWNQVAQQLAGPTYQATPVKAPTASAPATGMLGTGSGLVGPYKNTGQQGGVRPTMNIGAGISGRRAYNV